MSQYSVKRVFKIIEIRDILNFFICITVFPFAMIAKIFIRNFWRDIKVMFMTVFAMLGKKYEDNYTETGDERFAEDDVSVE